MKAIANLFGLRRLMSCAALATVLSAAMCGSMSAQDATQAKSPTDLLQDFRAGWDETTWVPTTGRMSKYMRPDDDSAWAVRMRILADLARRGPDAGPSLVDALKSGQPPVRALAAQALGFSGYTAARPDLAFAAQHDADPLVRLNAVDSLGMLGGTDYTDLLRQLDASEKNGDVKRHIKYALERAGEPVEPAIVAALKQWNPDDAAKARLGAVAPDFELTSITGERVKLSDFRGKSAVVLVFVYGDT